MTRLFTFSKEERLSHKKAIDALFNQGSSFNLSPFKVIYLRQTPAMAVPVQVLVGVPKKKFKRAVDRNRLRRMIREAYRLNKHRLTDHTEALPYTLQVGFIYIADRLDIPFAELEKQMVSCLDRMVKIIGDNRNTGRSASGGGDGVY